MDACTTCGTEHGDTPCPGAPSAGGTETVRCLVCREDREVPTGAPFTCPGCGAHLARFECAHCGGPSKAWISAGAPFTSCLGCGRKVELGPHVAAAPVSAEPACPHCGTRGAVRLQDEVAKQGVSGSKATAAFITGGLSIVATGLSRKGLVTKASCGACGATWTV